MMRALILSLALLLAAAAPVAADRGRTEAAFRAWLDEMARPAAGAAGVSRGTFDAATAGLTLDWDLPDLVPPGSKAKAPGGAFQAEFTGPASYLAEKKLAGLAGGARARAKKWGKTLSAVERATGVPPGVVLAIWGKESGFGTAAMPKEAVRTLATHAFMGGRKEMFLAELVAALKMLDEDHLTLAAMRGSWAGAMGQPQFMPSKFLAHAVDFDRDGRRDIWGSVPDTLGSIGHFLKDAGWRAGVPWGVEVAVPEGVSCALEGPDGGKPVGEWAAMGVTRIDGRPVGRGDVGPTGHLLMPAGRLGPAFLVSENFYVIKRYNESDLYALLVGHVGDRVGADARIAAGWAPLGGFKRGDVRRLQIALETMGHDVGGTDGLVGWRTRVAIGRWQEGRGQAATCFPDKGTFRALK